MNKYTEVQNAQGFAKKCNLSWCLKLIKSLYGMVEAPSLWFEALYKALCSQGFVPSNADPCFFIKKENKMIIITYVDDCLLFCKDQTSLDKLIQ